MSTLNSNEPKGRPPAPLFPLDQVEFSLAADYRIYVRKDLLQSGQADPSKSESGAHELVQLQPEDPISMDFDMKDAAWVDLKQAVLRTVESSQDEPNFGRILHELDSNGKLKWRAHMFGYDWQVASYALPFDFAKFSINFTTAKTQITASIGIIMDYPLKAIRSRSKCSPNEQVLMLHMMMYDLVNRNHSSHASHIGESTPGTRALVPAQGSSQPVDIRKFIQKELRQILMRPDLQAYGRTQARGMASLPMSPLVLMNGVIEEKDPEWKTINLPTGYVAGDSTAIESIQKLTRELLKYEKRSLTRYLLDGLEPSNEEIPVLPLDRIINLVVKHFAPRIALMPSSLAPEVRTATRVRFAYLRLQMLIDHQKVRSWAENSNHWNTIDNHLETLLAKSADYRLSFAQLVLDYDKELFNNVNTGSDIAEMEVVLPSEEESPETNIMYCNSTQYKLAVAKALGPNKPVVY
ncbi:hypothetical protein PCANC_05878 [Puccinia coronata f. sp. avenae]|uniref:Uncharacterized protein n=1 Tax=Puccinia coronata f. sp. avenae TaxID=200324 RepID=A0A2N5VBM7_9BASI|nr:hypothetical protein PCANC_05878 [Puccinia coronata f. sp. avenae]